MKLECALLAGISFAVFAQDPPPPPEQAQQEDLMNAVPAHAGPRQSDRQADVQFTGNGDRAGQVARI
jgi:hypothetical protein